MRIRNRAKGLFSGAIIGLIWASPASAGADPVPLPGSLALLATGVAALAAAGWWMRRK
jgi:hypothetical protein